MSGELQGSREGLKRQQCRAGMPACLPAQPRADRNVRATLGQFPQRRASAGRSRICFQFPPVIRQGSGDGAAATGSPGRIGSTGSTGLEDEDEDEDEDEKAPRSQPGAAGPFSWGRTSVSANRDSS